MVTDLAEIARLDEAKQLENEHFYYFLKGWNPTRLDQHVHQLYKDVSAAIDCRTCGNCCRSFQVQVEASDIEPLANRLGISNDDLQSTYLERNTEGWQVSKSPCHFLSGNECTVYEQRFTDCRSFPHLDKPHFQGRLLTVFITYSHCPIVFNVIEQLKEKLGFNNF